MKNCSCWDMYQQLVKLHIQNMHQQGDQIGFDKGCPVYMEDLDYI